MESRGWETGGEAQVWPIFGHSSRHISERPIDLCYYSRLQCVSKRMELSETGFYEPYRALLKLTTQLDGLSYYTRVWQGTIGSIFGVPTVPYSALQSLYLGQYKLLSKPCFAKFHSF